MSKKKTLTTGIDLKLQTLRVLIRKNSKKIIDHVINKHVVRRNGKIVANKIQDICMFCGSNKNITKEHVYPKWVFDNNPANYFITNINGLPQYYIKTTIPVCSNCNSNLLSALEKYIQQLFLDIDLNNDYFTDNEIENIIRWLEIIDYKFQILNMRRTFLRSEERGRIEYLADFPISILRKDTPSMAISEMRRSQKRITIKEKTKFVNSLVMFHTSNPGHNFFHTMDEFIFIEVPKYGKALFYFYKREFRSKKSAFKAADKIIDKCYPTKDKS